MRLKVCLELGIWSLGFRGAYLACFLLTSTIASAEELPRKAKTPRESYPNVDMIYDSVTSHDHYQTAQCERETPGHFRRRLVELRFG